MTIPRNLLDAVRQRQCVLFLGAGVHYPPPEGAEYEYPKEHRPPLGAAFSRDLADECTKELDEESKADVLDETGLDDKQRERDRFDQTIREEQREKKRIYLRNHHESLQRTSWYYEVHKDRAALVQKVTNAVDTQKQPSPVVRALAEIDFPIVITTNYDRLFEQSLGLYGKKVSPLVYDPERRETEDLLGLPAKEERWLFKIHGCVSRPESIVITDEDYIRFVMRMNADESFHPIPQKIRTQLAEWPTLFVGYSLLDYNLRLLFRTLRWRIKAAQRPPTYSLDLYPDLLVEATYGALANQGAKEPWVRFIADDIWKFVPQFYKELFGRPMPR